MMPDKWPSFVTKDLGTSDEDDAEMTRRWEVYDREMKVLIAAGAVHQDEDGWWVDTATGHLIGPDPEDMRPRTEEELARFKPVGEFPDLAAAIEPTSEQNRFSSKRPLTDEEEAEIQAMIAADPDDEELTEEMAAQRMTFAEACPDQAAAIKRLKSTCDPT